MGVAVPKDAEVGMKITLSSYPGGVMASGTVDAPWAGECRRCGGPVSGQLQVAVRERYVESGGSGTSSSSPASPSPASADDEDAYPMTDDTLDLEPLARDAILLELPLAPLCRDDCLGLCPVCGANRNDEPCACEQPPDPRWSALDVLRDAEGDAEGDGEGGEEGNGEPISGA